MAYQTYSTSSSVIASLNLMVIDFCNEHKINIPEECKLFEMDERIPINTWINILNKIKKQNNEIGLGLKIADYIQPCYCGILFYIMISSQTILEIISNFVKFYKLTFDLEDFDIKFNENEIVFSTNTTYGQLIDENIIAMFFKIIEIRCAPSPLPVKKVGFSSLKPNNTKVYENYFQCTVSFGEINNFICFDISLLNQMITFETDQILNKILKIQANSLLDKLPTHNTFEQQINSNIVKSILENRINIDNLAKKMGMSTSSLRIKLNMLGKDFHNLVSESKENLAKEYLTNTDLEINKISLILGYSEQSAFQRAFKRWTGMTPFKWRRNIKKL